MESVRMHLALPTWPLWFFCSMNSGAVKKKRFIQSCICTTKQIAKAGNNNINEIKFETEMLNSGFENKIKNTIRINSKLCKMIWFYVFMPFFKKNNNFLFHLIHLIFSIKLPCTSQLTFAGMSAVLCWKSYLLLYLSFLSVIEGVIPLTSQQ